jgi:hypothetical protein
MNKKTLLLLLVAFVLSFSVTFFIIRSNDHKECESVIKRFTDKNGNKVVLKEHVCKEKYAF